MSEILFADDDAAMRQMVAEVLNAAGHRTRLASSGTEALEALRGTLPDLVVLDYRMGRPNGLEVCREIKGTPRLEHLPVLILTAQGGAEDKLQGFDAGADDYLAKPFDTRELLARVRALLRLSERGLERNPTTRLPGGDAILREFRRRAAQGEELAVAYFDLDHFKPFGDRFGFSLGDRVIQLVGSLMRECAAADDFVGHIGGDDFLLMCGVEGARALTERIQAEFEARLREAVPAEAAERGRYTAASREGDAREFPLPRLSAALLYLEPRDWDGMEALGDVVAQVKLLAKRSEQGLSERELRPAPPR